MARTPSQIKTDIDAQITTKTGAYSIDNIDVGNRMKEIVDLASPIQFATTAARLAYLGGSTNLPFQEADDLQDGGKYYLSSDRTQWIPIGSAGAVSNTEIVTFTNQATLTIAWDNTRKAKFGGGGMFVVETLDADGKYRQKYGLEIYPDDINNTASYHIDLGGSLQSGRVIIK